jgi:predicted nucleic acid-binding protein
VIFVDTSFWVAAGRTSDPRHIEARRLLERHADEILASSSHVLGETWSLARRRSGHAAAIALIDGIARTPRLARFHVEREDERIAWAWLRRRPEREYSFVDATSFALMRRLAIHEVFAFDSDFSAAGFVELRA